MNTVIYRVPEKKLSIICLANTSDFLTVQLRKLGEECYERAAGIVLGWEPGERRATEETKSKRDGICRRAGGLPDMHSNRLVGNYEDPGSSHIWEVSLEGMNVNVLENYSKRFCS